MSAALIEQLRAAAEQMEKSADLLFLRAPGVARVHQLAANDLESHARALSRQAAQAREALATAEGRPAGERTVAAIAKATGAMS